MQYKLIIRITNLPEIAVFFKVTMLINGRPLLLANTDEF